MLKSPTRSLNRQVTMQIFDCTVNECSFIWNWRHQLLLICPFSNFARPSTSLFAIRFETFQELLYYPVHKLLIPLKTKFNQFFLNLFNFRWQTYLKTVEKVQIDLRNFYMNSWNKNYDAYVRKKFKYLKKTGIMFSLKV